MMIHSLGRCPNIKQRVVNIITTLLLVACYITPKYNTPTTTQKRDADPMLLLFWADMYCIGQL